LPLSGSHDAFKTILVDDGPASASAHQTYGAHSETASTGGACQELPGQDGDATLALCLGAAARLRPVDDDCSAARPCLPWIEQTPSPQAPPGFNLRVRFGLRF
jgi:hypothetical protein